MSDTALNKVIQYGTQAERLAFTPDPAVGSQVLYIWFETDHEPDTYAWDGSAWVQINPGGAGTVTTTGSPSSGDIAKFSGPTSITDATVTGTGDVVLATSPTLVTPALGTPTALVLTSATGLVTAGINASQVTLAKIANAAANSVLVGSGAAGSGLAYSEISLGTNLSMSGTTLNASGGSSVVVQAVSTETGAVATGSTAIPTDDTIPQQTEGVQFMSLAITPTSATNRLRIDVVFQASAALANKWINAPLFQDAGANAIAYGAQFQTTATAMATVSYTHWMTAGTTSATTFKVRGGCQDTTTMTFNGQSGGRLYGGVIASSITITEYTP
jgi:hypothetical protein